MISFAGGPLAAGRAEGIALLERGCDGGVAKGCRVLGVILRPTQAAVAFARRGCDAGDGGSCSVLAQDYAGGLGVGRDFEQSKRLTRRACDLRWCAACQALSVDEFRKCAAP